MISPKALGRSNAVAADVRRRIDDALPEPPPPYVGGYAILS